MPLKQTKATTLVEACVMSGALKNAMMRAHKNSLKADQMESMFYIVSSILYRILVVTLPELILSMRMSIEHWPLLDLMVELGYRFADTSGPTRTITHAKLLA
jgi:hypothetical protein